MTWVMIFYLSVGADGTIARIAPQLFDTEAECLQFAAQLKKFEPNAVAVCIQASKPQ